MSKVLFRMPCSRAAQFSTTYRRRTKKGKLVVVVRKSSQDKKRKQLIGGAGLALSAVTGFTPVDYYRWKAATGN